MTFNNLEFTIKQCEDHLDHANVRNTEIENYFVQYLLVRICAEFEERVVTLIRRRCSRVRDRHVRAFAQKTAEDVCRRFDIKDILKVLERFGPDYKLAFHGSVMTGMAHIAWNNIYSNRHAVAHKAGTQMSLGDLKKNYTESLMVLDAIVSSLNLGPKEVADLR